jgi:hypothetical protein
LYCSTGPSIDVGDFGIIVMVGVTPALAAAMAANPATLPVCYCKRLGPAVPCHGCVAVWLCAHR